MLSEAYNRAYTSVLINRFCYLPKFDPCRRLRTYWVVRVQGSGLRVYDGASMFLLKICPKITTQMLRDVT